MLVRPFVGAGRGGPAVLPAYVSQLLLALVPWHGLHLLLSLSAGLCWAPAPPAAPADGAGSCCKASEFGPDPAGYHGCQALSATALLVE